MFAIWAKQLDDDGRILRHDTFKFKQEFQPEYLFAYLNIVCSEWKIETPVVLKKHIVYLAQFGSVKFVKDDFVDIIDFSALKVDVIQ